MNSNSDKLTTGALISITVIGLAAIFLVVSLYSAWASAYVGVKLWTWFVVPAFGLPLITKAQAFGIALLCRFWTFQHFTSKCKDERTQTEKTTELVGLLISPWWVLLLGWICKVYFLGA